MAAKRIRPDEARAMLDAGGAYLVCAYESPAKFEQAKLEGAISLQELRSQTDSIPKESALIFY